MGKLFNFRWGEDAKEETPIVKEEIKAFSGKGDFNKSLKTILSQRGEGWETLAEIPGFSNIQVHGFNLFYNTYINKIFEHELQRIEEYRSMAATPEISDVIEDAVNESTQEDDVGEVFHLNIRDKKLIENENIVKNLKSEFNDLFRKQLDMKSKIWDILWTFYIDGRVYYERVIDENKKKDGIINVKKLPSETMDFFYNPISGKIDGFIQYIKPKAKKPANLKEARERDGKDLIFFDPNQIGFIDYGIYGKSRFEIIGFLEKARVPFNQLKLLETAAIIMRVVRAPERYVFRIDTGSMPIEKALKYVELVKNKMQKKQTYDPRTGKLTHEPDVMGILENFYLPQCLRISNTYIDLLDGRSISLEELINEHNEGKKHEVYSIDQNTGRILRGEVEWAGITRKEAEIVRVHLDNGEYVDCTPDHKFVMRDGREIEAKYLNPNDSLMPLYKKREKINKNTNDYLMVFSPEDNRYEFVHRLLGPKQKKGNSIHHKNFNRFDNTKDNLESLSIKEHIRLHYKSNKERESHIPINMNTYVEFKEKVIVNHKVVMVEKLSYREDTGCLTIKDPKENHNFGLSVGVFVKNSADGRGSTIETIGGNTSMYSELDDIYYFQKKLYRALKYPGSRVTATQEGRDAEQLFGGQQTSEISRDEIKWAKFLERQQKRICKDLTDMFLLHLEFKGLKKVYDLTNQKIEISMNPPSKYKEQMEQMFNDSRFSNYQQLADRPEMSRYYLMTRYLKWDDEEIKANVDGKAKDVKLGLAQEEGGGDNRW